MSSQNVVYYISYEDIQNQDILFNDIYVLNRYPKKLEHFHDDYMMDELDYDELFEKIAILRENFNDSQKAIIDDFF